jgi:hypothetical protein
MSTRLRTLGILAVSCVLLFVLMQKAYANPNHLEPIPPYSPLDTDDTLHSYAQAVFTSLIGKGWLPEMWMIEKPSFSREYAVIIRVLANGPNDPRPPEGTPRRWVVDYVAPKEKIWRWKEVSGDGVSPDANPTNTRRGGTWSVPDIRPTKDVERHRIEVTEDFAKVVYRAWLGTLLLTRYGEDGRTGMDGTTLEFCCVDLLGQTWSPETGLPAMLADLGRKLGTLAQSDEKDRGPMLAEAESLARTITKEAEAEQIKLFGKKMSRSWGQSRKAVYLQEMGRGQP